MTDAKWRVRLGAEAEQDFIRILEYTFETYGPRQTEIYKTLISTALAELTAGPNAPGSAARDEILPHLRTMHIGKRGRPGRHFIMYRAKGEVIEVLRILHDSMELARHLPPDRV